VNRTMLKSKIHRATVTDADLDYEGSIGIDRHLMELADLLPFQQVQVYNITTGARFETYAIAGRPGSGDMCLNGAAARLVSPGDRVIVISYADYDQGDLEHHEPVVVHVDAANRRIDAAAAERLATG